MRAASRPRRRSASRSTATSSATRTAASHRRTSLARAAVKWGDDGPAAGRQRRGRRRGRAVSEHGIALSVAEGGAALTVAPRELPLASLEKMEVAVPELRGAPGVPLTPERARRRRGRLRSAVIKVDEQRIGAAVDAAALAEAGVSD